MLLVATFRHPFDTFPSHLDFFCTNTCLISGQNRFTGKWFSFSHFSPQILHQTCCKSPKLTVLAQFCSKLFTFTRKLAPKRQIFLCHADFFPIPSSHERKLKQNWSRPKKARYYWMRKSFLRSVPMASKTRTILRRAPIVFWEKERGMKIEGSWERVRGKAREGGKLLGQLSQTFNLSLKRCDMRSLRKVGKDFNCIFWFDSN